MTSLSLPPSTELNQNLYTVSTTVYTTLYNGRIPILNLSTTYSALYVAVFNSCSSQRHLWLLSNLVISLLYKLLKFPISSGWWGCLLYSSINQSNWWAIYSNVCDEKCSRVPWKGRFFSQFFERVHFHCKYSRYLPGIQDAAEHYTQVADLAGTTLHCKHQY